MNTSRSFPSGGRLCSLGEIMPGMAAPQPARRAGAVRGPQRTIRHRHWLLIGGAILMLAGRLAQGGESPPRHTDEEGGREAFTTGFPVKYTLAAPSDARLKPRITPGAGARDSYFLTRNFGLSSTDAASHGAAVRPGDSHRSLVLLTPAQASLLTLVAVKVSRHFELLSTWSNGSGAGASYPINSTMGLFFDARSIMPGVTRYYGVARVGVRVVF